MELSSPRKEISEKVSYVISDRDLLKSAFLLLCFCTGLDRWTTFCCVGSVKLTPSTNADKPDESIEIDAREPVTASFAGKYLNMFAKAAPLSSRVSLSMSADVPMGNGKV